MTKTFSFLYLTFILIGCKRVHFDGDMPKRIKSLHKFDSIYLGNYYFADSTFKLEKELFYNDNYRNTNISNKDSIKTFSIEFSVSERIICFSFIFRGAYNLSSIDSALIKKAHRSAKIKVENEYLICEEGLTDTFINLDLGDKAKFHDGKIYLNKMLSKNEWEVIQISFNKDSSISINQTNEMDQNKLRHTFYSDENPITGNIAHISNEQFYYFIRQGGFRDRTVFKKVR